jgi:hypothetical protein
VRVFLEAEAYLGDPLATVQLIPWIFSAKRSKIKFAGFETFSRLSRRAMLWG